MPIVFRITKCSGTIANVAKNNPFSTFGCKVYVNSITNNIHEWHSRIMPEEILCIDTVRELIEVRDGRKIIAGLDRTELLDLLHGKMKSAMYVGWLCVCLCVRVS